MANEIHIGQSHNIYRAGVHRTKADPNCGHGHIPGGVGGAGSQASGKFDILCRGDKSVKITSSRITTLLTIGENLNIEFKRAGNGPKADTFESVCAFLNKTGNLRNLYHYVKIYSNAEPVFDEDDVFRLTVPLDDAYSADRAFAEGVPQTDTAQETVVKGGMKGGMESGMKTADAIITLMRADSLITHDILAARLGKARNSIIKQIAKLKKIGLIRRVGPDKGGHWEVIG